jgi:hypothetical protein
VNLVISSDVLGNHLARVAEADEVVNSTAVARFRERLACVEVLMTNTEKRGFRSVLAPVAAATIALRPRVA